MRGIVDRFEDEFVIIEIDGKTKDFPRASVGEDVAVGDVVELKEAKWFTDKVATEKRSHEIKSLLDSIWED
ncbi:DUF3006 domain-containing protein [Bacillus massiliigorillae]|uniref:DUF3006 domain-containing protein n=1 Tax=Bacillus massiliigorillae TaxID=1243664 RepID=UPI0003A7D259|nr:DUF3006 domain-containing protein [Bacillus massiliigorillae]